MHRIGDPIPENHPAIFLLDIEEMITYADPARYGIKIEGINPKEYFITSGDAIEKTKVLQNDFKNHHNDVKILIIEYISKKLKISTKEAKAKAKKADGQVVSKKLLAYELHIRKNLTQVKSLLKELIKARGGKKFLETEWENHSLHLTPKNPRAI